MRYGDTTDQPTHVYMDINIINNDQTGLNPYPKIIFNEIRNNPYLQSPQDYYMSVVRFQLQTSGLLPSYIPQIKLGSLNRDETIYSFTLEGRDPSGVLHTSQTYVTWKPEDLQHLNDPNLLPPIPTTVKGNSYQYYYGYSIQHFVDRMNVALETCATALRVAGVDLSANENPYFILDEGTKRLSLIASGRIYVPGFFNVKIYCNSPMFNLINSFQAEYYGINVTDGKNYRLVVENKNNTNFYYVNGIAIPPNPPAFQYVALQMFQEYQTIDLWNAVDRIVFTTGLLPVTPSLATQPVIYNSSQEQLLQSGNNSMVVPLITDMQDQSQSQGTGGIAYKPVLSYLPTAEYRLMDLYGNNPLSALQISVLWADKFGNYYPLYLASGCNASLKIMFRKKSFESNE